MLEQLEIFLGKFPNILDCLTAIGTVGAVICSLYFSQLALKPRIKATLYKSFPLYSHRGNVYKHEKEHISLLITNNGHIPIYLYYHNCFYWRIPFCRGGWREYAQTPIFIDKPFEIEPHKSFDFVLAEYDDFIIKFKKFLGEKSFSPKALLNFLSFKIRTDNNTLIKATIDKKLLSKILKDI